MADLHPEGVYKAEVLAAVLGESKTGKPQIIADFTTEHGRVRGYFSLSEKSVEYTAEKMMAMGFRGPSWSDVNLAAYSMVGNKVTVTVQHDEWEGKFSAKVAFVNREDYSPELQGSELASANAKKFDAILHAVRARVEKGEKRPPAKKVTMVAVALPPATPGVQEGDSSIPF